MRFMKRNNPERGAEDELHKLPLVLNNYAVLQLQRNKKAEAKEKLQHAQAILAKTKQNSKTHDAASVTIQYNLA